LPTSRLISAASSKARSLMRSAARRRIFTRSVQGVRLQAGKAAFAAATASATSSGVPRWKIPSSQSVLIGERSSKVRSA
jgi:hypothetical protein